MTETKNIIVEVPPYVKIEEGGSINVYVDDRWVAGTVGSIKNIESERIEKRGMEHPKTLEKEERVKIVSTNSDTIWIKIVVKEEKFSDECWSSEKKIIVKLNGFVIYKDHKKKYPWQ